MISGYAVTKTFRGPRAAAGLTALPLVALVLASFDSALVYAAELAMRAIGAL
ncbi:hypothetical protein [Methylopila sp. M107]|uniref:hypothetical protein n=1 Tax=Methylopila sp. M107 TaxID=1101190 RepID=UPI00037414D2|nr:hypothetical protein [Methylopila sp. M107]